MSRASLQDISNLGRPLTDDEKKYLKYRGRGWEIEVNKNQFPDGGKSGVDLGGELEYKSEIEGDFSKFDPNLVKEIQALSPADLRAELKARDITPPTGANKGHLQFVLIQAVANSPEK